MATTTKGPSYYKRGSTDVWDFIREQELNFHLGNAIKYICRAGYKDSKIQDLNKAIHYLTNELEHEANLLIRPSKAISKEVQPEERSFTYDEIVSERSDC
jgi:hypothetical protein